LLVSVSVVPHTNYWLSIMMIAIARAVILPVRCGCETWSVTLREENRLRVFENGVLRETLGVSWRK
jgi:hypothetical protein